MKTSWKDRKCRNSRCDGGAFVYSQFPNHIAYGYVPQPIRDGAGATDPGPRDILRDLENPDMLVPPATDAGLLPNMRFSFSDTHMTLRPGGWSREITSRELPVAKTMAGVARREHTHCRHLQLPRCKDHRCGTGGNQTRRHAGNPLASQ